MKRLSLILIAIVLAAAGCTPMTPKEKILFGAMLAAHAADYETTRKGMSRGMTELNPVLGERPDQGSIALFKLGAVGVTYILGEIFSDQREFIYTAGIVTAGGAAINNDIQLRRHE